MEDNKMTFLNLVVQKIIPDTIQDFMKAWLHQECKNFRIVFVDKDLDDKQRQALEYALEFAKSLGMSDTVFVDNKDTEIPQAQQTRDLESTEILPRDKMEVMRLCGGTKKVQTHSIPSKHQSEIQKVLSIEAKSENKTQTWMIEKQDEDVKIQTTEKNAFFRIIVPNYNNLVYVKKCLDSLLEQTFKDFIAVIIDDLSSDGSDKICQSYAKRYPKNFVFMQLSKKGYAGAARNAGLDYPLKSRYTMFLDSDDWMYDKNVLEKIHSAIVAKKYPKILRCPLYHFLGQNSKRNRVDQIPLDKMKILLAGAGPSRNCIQSDLVKRFVENRSKSNDVVWFLRTIDKIKQSEIAGVEFPCEVYNRISTTSCQNNINVMISKKCVADQKLLSKDLKKETFTSKECIKFQQDIIQERERLYKPTISMKDLMTNSYVISIDQLRYQTFSKIFKNAGLSPIPTLKLGSTSEDMTPVQNCAHSHIQAVKTAKLKDLPYVCIFEDDAFPCIDASHTLTRYLNCIPYDADLVLLGWSNYNKRKRQSFSAPFNRILQPDISGSHAYLLFKSGYDQYVSFFDENPNRRADNDIFMSVGKGYILNYPLFIQYSEQKSMNNHVGYIFYGDHNTPPIGFPPIDYYLKGRK